LRDFIIENTIRFRLRYDPETWLENVVRELVTNRFEITRQTEVKMILKCMMQRIDLETGEETIVEVPFHSGVELNLAADVYEMYDRMVDRIEERLAAFQRQGTWAFLSIVWLEIHTVGGSGSQWTLIV